MNGNCGSQNNVYIGARYVPKIVGEWSADIAYEPLTVVLYQGTSYTSITYVPKGIIPSENSKQYWALTGNYNAQVEAYRQEVINIDNKLTANLKKLGWGLNVVYPDLFGSDNTSDSDKLQMCFDYANDNNIKIIEIDREYNIEKPIIIKNNGDGNNIRVIGIGSNSGFTISNNQTLFKSPTINNGRTSYGSILFEGLRFNGVDRTTILVDCNYLLRIYLNNCTIQNFNYVFYCYSAGIMQSIQLFNCNIILNKYVYYQLEGQAHDLKIVKCNIKRNENVFWFNSYANSMVIQDNVIEYNTGTVLYIIDGYGLQVSGNYFETNEECINLSKSQVNAYIFSNYSYSSDNTKAFIIFNKEHVKNITVSNNGISNMLLYDFVESPTFIIRVHVFDNFGALNNTTYPYVFSGQLPLTPINTEYKNYLIMDGDGIFSCNIPLTFDENVYKLELQNVTLTNQGERDTSKYTLLSKRFGYMIKCTDATEQEAIKSKSLAVGVKVLPR